MRRSVAVDALRGVAVVLVLLHHLDIGVLVDGSAWLLPVTLLHEAGFLGVSLFLVLSGFSIHLRVASGGSFAARPFLLRRFVRLQPTYYVALACALLLALVGVLAGYTWPQPRWGLPGPPIPTWALLLTHLSVLAGTIVPPGWLSITWSLALKEQIYLLYAAGPTPRSSAPPSCWPALSWRPRPGGWRCAAWPVALSIAGTMLLHRYVEAPCTARSQRIGRLRPERVAVSPS